MPRQPRPPVPPWTKSWFDFFRLVMRAGDMSERTITMIIDIAGWFAGWLAAEEPAIDDWAQVKKEHLLRWFVWLKDCGYSQGYRHNAGGCLQRFFKWWAAEESAPDPFTKISPPPAVRLGSRPPEVIASEQVTALIADAERSRDFEAVRDAALLRLFAATGGRLSEIALMDVDAVDLGRREATITGKGNKTRIVRYDARAAVALKRYLNARAKRPAVTEDGVTALWIGVRRRCGMTPSGVRQVVERRGERLGLDIHPHLFRHTFAHEWLLRGGAECDLMELAGWESPAMLRHYGRSAAAARARTHYDQIMGGGR